MLYVGTVGGLEAEIVARAGVPFVAVEAAGVRGLSAWRALLNGLKLLTGGVQAWRVVRSFRPDVVLATGGYASAPVVAAAWLQRCPVMIYLPDVEPGLAVRVLSHLARRVAVSFADSARYFPPAKTVVTGYPVRSALYRGGKLSARQSLGLAVDGKVLLVFGGSRGAHRLNLAVGEALERLLAVAQVVHIAGSADAAWLARRCEELPAAYRGRYHLHSYLHEEMTDALQAADLAVARAGAATMGEFAAVGLPSILVPYPYSGQHQAANAELMVRRGAALKWDDSALAEKVLAGAVEKLLADDRMLGSMAENARLLARPDAAKVIARDLLRLSGEA